MRGNWPSVVSEFWRVECVSYEKMVYQSSNARVMSKSIQTTSKQTQSHQLQHEESAKRMPTKSGACASQHQSHHSRNEYVNVKSQCRRDSQSALQNSKPSYRCEVASGHQVMPSAAKCRNDYKSDNYPQDINNDSRLSNESRHNGTSMTDIYADDSAEVKTINIHTHTQTN